MESIAVPCFRWGTGGGGGCKSLCLYSCSDCTYKLFFYSVINFMLPFQLMPHFDFLRTTNGFNRNLEKHPDAFTARDNYLWCPLCLCKQTVHLSFWVWTRCWSIAALPYEERGQADVWVSSLCQLGWTQSRYSSEKSHTGTCCWRKTQTLGLM